MFLGRRSAAYVLISVLCDGCCDEAASITEEVWLFETAFTAAVVPGSIDCECDAAYSASGGCSM